MKKLKVLIRERFNRIDAALNAPGEARLVGENRSDVTAIVNVENAVILELANDLVELVQVTNCEFVLPNYFFFYDDNCAHRYLPLFFW